MNRATRRTVDTIVALGAAAMLADLAADRDSARVITAAGASFSDTLAAAQGRPAPERPPSDRELVRGWLERRRLFSQAINQRMAELERELREGTG